MSVRSSVGDESKSNHHALQGEAGMFWDCLFKTWRCDTTKQLTIPQALNWIIRRIARIEDKENRLLETVLTKKDGAHILQAIKSLRDDLLKPTIEMTAGQPKDKEL